MIHVYQFYMDIANNERALKENMGSKALRLFQLG